VQQLLHDCRGGHVIRLVEPVKDPSERLWYARQAVAYGWSRSVLVHQIASKLPRRQGKAITSFERTFRLPQSELARDILKDAYSFSFLALGPEMSERDLERGLLSTCTRRSLSRARASPSSAASITSRSEARIIIWPRSPTTCGCAASSWLSLDRRQESPSSSLAIQHELACLANVEALRCERMHAVVSEIADAECAN
jgi:hypothetical protein